MSITAFKVVHQCLYSEPSKCSPYVSCFLKVHFNSVRLFTIRSSKVSSSLRFCHHYFESNCSHACYVSSAHLIPSVFRPGNNLWWEKIVTFPIMQFILSSFYFFSPLVQIFSSPLSSQISSAYVRTLMGETDFIPYKIMGKIITNSLTT